MPKQLHFRWNQYGKMTGYLITTSYLLVSPSQSAWCIDFTVVVWGTIRMYPTCVNYNTLLLRGVVAMCWVLSAVRWALRGVLLGDIAAWVVYTCVVSGPADSLFLSQLNEMSEVVEDIAEQRRRSVEAIEESLTPKKAFPPSPKTPEDNKSSPPQVCSTGSCRYLTVRITF